MKSEKDVKEGLEDCKAEIKNQATLLMAAAEKEDFEKITECAGIIITLTGAAIAVEEVLAD